MKGNKKALNVRRWRKKKEKWIFKKSLTSWSRSQSFTIMCCRLKPKKGKEDEHRIGSLTNDWLQEKKKRFERE